MSMNDKSTTPNDLCKGHAARGAKEFYRLCPSKLNKRELEDLYYSLLDKNLELKREMNMKNERIRTLNTKVQRMTAFSKPHVSNGKDCCSGARAHIVEQKQAIADLKKANETMAERIKRLNVKLCSAKQFLKQSPPQSYKGFKNTTVPSNSCRNLSSGFANKTSTDNMRSTAVSARSLASDHPETKSVETNTEAIYEKMKPEHEKKHVCREIECVSAVEEFQNRILELKEELSKTHEEYSSRMGHLERKVSLLQSARIQEAHMRPSKDIAVERADLATQVSLEKNKLADVEMRLKSANMSQEVASTIAEHLKNANRLEERRSLQIEKTPSPQPCVLSPMGVPPLSASGELAPDAPEAPYRSDDSGYNDTRRDSDHEEKVENGNRDLVKRIADLQSQLDAIKITANDHLQPTREPERMAANKNSYDVIVDQLDVPVLKNVKDYNCFIIDPEKKVIIEVEHVNKDASFETLNRDLIKNPEESKDNLEPNKDVSDVLEPLQSKRKSYIKPELPECSRKLSDSNIQQYDTINEQKRGIQDSYDGSGKSYLPLGLRTPEERFDVRPSKPACEVSKLVGDKDEIVQSNDFPQVQMQNGEKDYLVPKSQLNDSSQVQKQNDVKDSVLPKTQADKNKKDYLVPKSQPNDASQVQKQNVLKDSVLPKTQADKNKKDYLVPKSQPNDASQVQKQNVLKDSVLPKTQADKNKKDYLVPKSQPNDASQVQKQNDAKDSVLPKTQADKNKKDYLVPKSQPNDASQVQKQNVLKDSVLPKTQADKNKKDYLVPKSQPNDASQVQKQNDAKDSVLPKTQADKNKKDNNVICECSIEKEGPFKKQADKKKKDNGVICECPIKEEEPFKTQADKMKKGYNGICKCLMKEENPLKDSEPSGAENINKDRRNNRWSNIYCSVDDIKAIEKPMQITTPMQNAIPLVQNEPPSMQNATSSMQNAIPKSDNHNSLQIPGPLPVNSSRRDSIGNKGNHSQTKFKFLQSKRASIIKDKYDTHDGPGYRETQDQRESAITDTNMGDVNVTNMKPVENASITGPHVVFDKKNVIQSNESFPPKYFNYDNGQSDDMKNVNRPPEGQTSNRENPIQPSDIQNEAADTKTEIVKGFTQKCNDRRVNDKIEPRLETNPDSNHQCSSMKIHDLLTRDPSSKTFLVLSPHEKLSRATSPDNTDFEISHLSDLPTEKDGPSTRVLSPGEHKATSTSYSDSVPLYHDTSLSEGEVPNQHQKRKISISVGECTDEKPANNDYNQSSAEKMEAALQAISQELARCRALLETQRSWEVTYGHS